MSHKVILALVAVATYISHGICDGNGNNGQNTLTITISFESEIICTTHFFGSQLTKEIMEKFEKCKNITWVFEPCEESYIDDQTHKLYCLGDEQLCVLDRIQACAGNLYANDGFHYGLFVTCMLNVRDPMTSGPTCAKQASLCWDKINECVTSGKGDKYCDEFYRRITKRKPKWIPSIMFDNNYVEGDDTQAKKDFTKTVCSKLKAKHLTCDEVCKACVGDD